MLDRLLHLVWPTPPAKMPDKIVFIHVPKTAGSSITEYIIQHIAVNPEQKAVLVHDHRDHDPNNVVARVSAKTAFFAFGHIGTDTSDALTAGSRNPFVFTVLREPRERLRSLFLFMRNLPPSLAIDYEDVYAMKDAFEFFATQNARIRYLTDNFMVRQFAGELKSFPSSSTGPAMLAKAKKNLRRLDHVAFSDSFASDFARIITKIGFPVPPQVPKTNITEHGVKDQARYDQDKAVLNDAMNKLAGPLVYWDMQLWHYASAYLRVS